MLKAAIFDLNGIFIKGPKLSERFNQDFNISADTFMPALTQIMGRVRAPGAERAFTYWEPLLTQWDIDLPEEKFWEYWFGAERASEGMVDFAKDLRERGVKVFVLSNNFRERAEYYGHYSWMTEAVDKAYFSWQTGFVKPDARAWSTILEEYQLAPADCVYFDDQEKNVASAASLGIPAHLFENEDQLKAVVEGLMTPPVPVA